MGHLKHDLIRELRTTLGIPYERPEEYISAAYDILVLGKPLTPTQTNRFRLYHDCAIAARSILLDIAELPRNLNDEQIRLWLDIVETAVENYRGNYREIAGVDFGLSEVRITEQGSPRIVQQV
jgi:hypothetical protein